MAAKGRRFSPKLHDSSKMDNYITPATALGRLLRRALCAVALCLPCSLWAQQATYYASATGEKGAALKTALAHIVSDHTVRSYANLWVDFRETDCRPDGKVWDMYSCITDFTFGDDQAGNFKAEGDKYNREHSFPKSWWGGSSGIPAYTDLFHLYPTDGYVNGMRGNLPFGEVKSVTKQSAKGFSKVGPSAIAGYGGTVFEPADEYKGDFARTYFYMATAYESSFAGWAESEGGVMLAGNAWPGFKAWALDMLLQWAEDDPVSDKERDRNEAVYGIQHNRNPYIDYPGLEQYVWGECQDVAFDAADYKNPATIVGISVPVAAPSDADVPVYDLQGRRIARRHLHGIRIENGKKVTH